MKKIFIFDVDNTLVDSKIGKVPFKTEELIKKLYQKDDVILGIATGRGPGNIEEIVSIIDYFDILILGNGSYVSYKKEMVFDSPFSCLHIKKVLDSAEKYNITIGATGKKTSALLKLTDNIYQLRKKEAIIKIDFFKNEPIYQLWGASKSEKDLNNFVNSLKFLDFYHWSLGGVDLVYPKVSKKNGVLKILEYLNTPYQLIAVGDGHNDIELIEMADIGIAMSNTKFPDLIKKAHLVAPHVGEDELYNFFLENSFI